MLNVIIINACSSKSGVDTAGLPEATTPSVSSTIPANNASIVAVNGSVTATFSEEMNPLTITFTLKQGTNPVSGVLTYSGVTVVFTPDNNLTANTTYTALIATEASNLTGNTLTNDFIWSFKTGSAPDNTAPTVSSTIPANSATGIAVNSNILTTFSEGMDPLTIDTSTFTLKHGAAVVSGSVTYYGVTATFTPDADLLHSTVYTATVTTGVQDLAGNSLLVNKVWSFTTAGMGPAPVNLRTAGNFVILSKAGITIGAGNSITGDVGVSPIGSTALVGFGLVLNGSGTFSTSALLTGKAYASNYLAPTPDTLSTAIIHMGYAYSDAASRLGATDFTSGELGGRIIPPGLYTCGPVLD